MTATPAVPMPATSSPPMAVPSGNAAAVTADFAPLDAAAHLGRDDSLLDGPAEREERAIRDPCHGDEDRCQRPGGRQREGQDRQAAGGQDECQGGAVPDTGHDGRQEQRPD